MGADQLPISLAYLPPTARQTRTALVGAAALLLGLAILIPFAAVPLPRVDGFIPALDAIIFVTDFITAGLLLAYFSVVRSRAIWVLACGYLFSAAIVVMHGLTFPGVLSPTGNLFGGLHTNFRIYLLWHLGLPVAVLLYLWLRDERPPKAGAATPAEIAGTYGFVGIVSLVSCIACLTLVPAVPPVEGRWLTAITMLICAAALVALWIFRRSALDQWLMVVVLAMIVELAITALVGGRGPSTVTLGFYLGRLFSLITSTVVLAALLSETTKLYAGAARANLLATIASASQGLSGEIELPKLIERLVKIALGNARADRAILMLPSGDEYLIVAEGRAAGDQIDVTTHQERITEFPCPESIIHHVIHTKQSVVLDGNYQVINDGPFSGDPYLGLTRPGSVFCLPLVHQGVLRGVLYLENTLAPQVFTPERARLLELLASQAAISLENASLYTDRQRGEAFLAQGQRIGHTGSFGWSVASGEFYWSAELFDILEYDKEVHASIDLTIGRFHPDDRDRVSRLFDDARNGGADFESEHRLLMPDGRIKHVQTIGRAVHTGNLDFVGSVRDVTDRARAEETLRQSQADLAHVARIATLNAMAASIGHEVSQPLSGILNNSNACVRMLAADPPDVTAAAETVRRTIRDANRAAEVIRRLRAMFAKKAPTMELVDLNDAAREVIALSGGEVQSSGALLTTDLATGLPHVWGDRVQLQQVILNLLLNAADAMVEIRDRPRQLLIKTAVQADGDIKLSVRDSGSGVDINDTEKLFQAFYTTKVNGMGIGLSICRLIIESHDGRLWAEANDGPGATFSFCIPRASDQATVR